MADIDDEKKAGSHTIFDDVCRTMAEKLHSVLVSVINEHFGTNYSEDTKVINLVNEHMEICGDKIITDICVSIRQKKYHIECQSNPDGTISIRMLEYDFVIALDDIERVAPHHYRMIMPHSCVLYLRHTEGTPDKEVIDIQFTDGSIKQYEVPIIKVQDYTKEEILQKKLFFYFPYYFLKYEDRLEQLETKNELLQQLLKEYTEMVEKVYDNFTEAEAEVLCELAIRIVEHVARKESKVRKEVKKVMGGQILELEGDRRERLGREEGRVEGKIEGENRLASLISKILEKGLGVEEVSRVVKDMKYRERMYRRFTIL